MKNLIALVLVGTSLACGQGIIMTVAGNGTAGFSGDGGPATSAQLNFTTSTATGTLETATANPKGVAVDAVGNIYFADFGNERIRKFTLGGNITTIAGNGIAGFSGDGGPAISAEICTPEGIWLDSAGNLYIADEDGYARKISSGGTISTLAGIGGAGYSGDGGSAAQAGLYWPSGVAMDMAGNLYISDTRNNRIRKVAPGGTITTVAGNGTAGFSGDGGLATSAALDWPSAVAVDTAGNIYIADYYNGRIRKVTAGGTITTVAGGGFNFPGVNGSSATSVLLNNPSGVAVDAAGNLYFTDSYNNVVLKVTSGGTLTIVAGNGSQGFSGDGGPATSAALNFPTGIAVDAAGNVYFADNGNNRVREILSPPVSITQGGIVPIYSSATTIQPGEWVSIFGNNLASAPATWNNNFPTMLGGTTVTIDGKSAYLWYVSPMQINLQAPDDGVTGSVNVVVTTASGSATSTVTLGQFGPSFSVLDGKHVAGIIVRADGSYDILGPTGTSLGYSTVAAEAGDSVELYGVGFGPTSPSVPAGQVFSSTAPTTNAVTLTIGGTTVLPSFAGLSSAGLYQINVTIPAGIGTGDQPLVATVSGVQTQTGVLISLQ
jgi:uncharacterized protein (TIGR03437 family)